MAWCSAYQTTSCDAASGGSVVNQVEDIYNGLGNSYRVEKRDMIQNSRYMFGPNRCGDHDDDGNVTTKSNLLDYSLSLTYVYDDLNRLAEVKHGETAVESFTLDAVGNMSVADTTDRTSNSQNQLTAVGGNDLAYDSNGNTTTDAEGGTLVYDAWNRLISVSNGDALLKAYTYDGLGIRITESNTVITTDLYFS